MLSADMSPKEYESSSVNRALEVLQKTTGLNTTTLGLGPSGCDGHVTITADDGRVFTLLYEVKATIDRRDQLLTFKALHPGTLLITRSLSSAMAEQCRELNIQFVDHAGNCFLRQPGLFVFVSGSKDATKIKQAATRGLTPAALSVVFAVLTRPSILNTNVRRIAEVAAVSHGAAGGALIMLEEIGFFISAKSGRRVLAMPERWLDTWTEGYLGRVRPKLEKHRMGSSISISTILELVSPQMREVALGGEAAAAYRNMGLKPGALTLYIDFEDPSVMRHLVQELKLRATPKEKSSWSTCFGTQRSCHASQLCRTR